MNTLRFLGLAALMFAAAFLGMNWLPRVEPLKPDPRVPTFQQVDTDSPAYKLAQSSISDGRQRKALIRVDLEVLGLRTRV